MEVTELPNLGFGVVQMATFAPLVPVIEEFAPNTICVCPVFLMGMIQFYRIVAISCLGHLTNVVAVLSASVPTNYLP